ncbi:hypothetical protein FDW84_08010 [Pseudarthrobacter sp. NamE5]|nr:hypothetical protein FDW84_08010 [Pseudarthrobacter sp. NamE5]
MHSIHSLKITSRPAPHRKSDTARVSAHRRRTRAQVRIREVLVIERKHGRRRGPGPAKGGSRQLAVLGVVLVVVLAVVAFALTR